MPLTPFPLISAGAAPLVEDDFTAWASDWVITEEGAFNPWDGPNAILAQEAILAFWGNDEEAEQLPFLRSAWATRTYTPADYPALTPNTFVLVTVGATWKHGPGFGFVGMRVNGVAFDPGVGPSGTLTADTVPMVGYGTTDANGELTIQFAIEDFHPSFTLDISFDNLFVTTPTAELADIFYDAGVLYISGNAFSITRGGIHFDPQEEWEDYDFPGKSSPVEGCEEVVRTRPVLRTTCMLTGEYQFGVYKPGGVWTDHASIDGARTFTPAAVRQVLGAGLYLTSVVAVWPRARGDYVAVEFPRAICRRYSLGSRDRDEGEIPIEIEARVPRGQALGTTPYLIHTYAADTESIGSPAPPPDDSPDDPPADPFDPPDAPPEGAVEVFPGESIQAAVDDNDPGTVYLLKTGTHVQQSVTPQAGDTFWGESGTIMDGQNVTEFAFKGYNGAAWVDDVTLYGFTIRRYDPPAQNGAIWGGDDRLTSTSGWILRDMEVKESSNIGVRIGNGMQVLNSFLHHNGTLNIGGVGEDVLIDEGTEISFGNASAVDPGFEAGGTKFVKTTGLIVRACYVHDNNGPGLWLDINNIDYLIEDCQVDDNAREGICIEISYAGIIRNNTVTGNGAGDPWRAQGWLWNAGIGIHASPDVEVYGNTVTDNFNGIVAIQQPRGVPNGDPPEEFGPYIVENLNVHDNTITQNTAQAPGMVNAAAGAVQDVPDNAIFTTRNNLWTNNTYNLLSPTFGFAWMNAVRTEAEWVAYGHDVGGTFNY